MVGLWRGTHDDEKVRELTGGKVVGVSVDVVQSWFDNANDAGSSNLLRDNSMNGQPQMHALLYECYRQSKTLVKESRGWVERVEAGIEKNQMPLGRGTARVMRESAPGRTWSFGDAGPPKIHQAMPP